MVRPGWQNLFSHVLAAIILAVSSRIALFFGSMAIPVPNEQGLPISPLTANTAIDLGYYIWARDIFFRKPQVVLDYFQSLIAGNANSGFFLPGPIFPSLLELFNYGPDNTITLSAVYLCLSAVLVTAWLWWLAWKNIRPVWLYIFALLPTPYWFMLNISTDLLFAVVVGAFWLLWVERHLHFPRRMLSTVCILAIAILLRPNAMSLLLYLLIDVLIWEIVNARNSDARKMGVYFMGFVMMITGMFALFYTPYLRVVVVNSIDVSYFGVPASAYINGLWPSLPGIVNTVLSWTVFLGAKMLYAAGLRPSFGDTATPLVFLRMLPGIFVLPGMIWVFVCAGWRERLFVFMFMGPIILGVTQDRYVLPIQPILFFYSARAWEAFAQLCLRLYRK